jgi:asparagine synthetase B (glutamine-hydrolysing)
MVEKLGSEFAFVIFDISKDKKVKAFAARDPIGVRPLFYS